MIINQTAHPRPGWLEFHRMTTGYFWRGPARPADMLLEQDIDWPYAIDEIIKRRAAPLIINIEGGPWEKPGEHTEVRERWIDLIRTVRRAHGGPVGIYRMVPEAGYWQPIRFYRKDDPGNEHRKWRIRNNRLHKLADEVDFICPSIYPEPADWYRKPAHWAAMVAGNIREAEQYEKPVWPFITPQFQGFANQAMVPLDEWREQIAVVRQLTDTICLFMDAGQPCPEEYAAAVDELFGGRPPTPGDPA